MASSMEVSSLKRVLIVEDHDTNRAMLREFVSMCGGFPVDVGDGVAALDEIHAQIPDLVILDLRLPRMDGMTVLRRLRENPDFRSLPIVVVSALTELEHISQCIELGAIDFLPKPIKPAVLRARLASYLARRRYYTSDESCGLFPREFAREVVSSLELLKSSCASEQIDWSTALFDVLARYNPETREHLDRMAAYCRTLLRQLRNDPLYRHVITDSYIELFATTSALHDIGKLAVPGRILSKPGPLDADEHRVMRRHVTVGAEILRELLVQFPDDPGLGLAIELTLHHHERWDGAGYPFGLAGEAIPMAGRVMALADVYDALTSQRCYKRAFSHQESRDIILGATGKQFDPKIAAAFLACEGEFQRISAPYSAQQSEPESPAKGQAETNGQSLLFRVRAATA
jgi:putative two-component system response regulator